MSKLIDWKDGQLHVPDNPVIPCITGDGIGHDITPAMKNIVDVAVEAVYKGERKISWLDVTVGQEALKQYGTLLPDDTFKVFEKYKVGIKGPLMTPVGKGARSLNVALRQKLDLYVCLRPIRWFEGITSPVVSPDKVDVTIFRENTEDVYAGMEYMAGEPETQQIIDILKKDFGETRIPNESTTSIGIKPVSKEGSQRLVEAAIAYAIKMNKPSVTLVHKGNIMKYTEGGFLNWGYDVADQKFSSETFTRNQYNHILEKENKAKAEQALEDARKNGKVIVWDVIADAFFQESLLHPERHSVVATLNLNGDYASDHLAAMVGGIGISPGANINYQTGCAIFEATHGTAPDIAGQDIANPCSMVLSATMMLQYMGWNKAAEMIVNSIETMMRENNMTKDLLIDRDHIEPMSTSAFSSKICELLQAD